VSLKSELRSMEAAIASWRMPPEPPIDKLRKTAADYGLPLDRVIAIWQRVSTVAPHGFVGSALLYYVSELQEASDEYAALCKDEV